MNDRDALFAAILAHPDEDTPRLVFADYLEENGEERYAAFIRKQIELAKVPEWDALRIRAWNSDHDSLTGRGFDTFQRQLPAGMSWPTLETFRRGFPWHVQTVEGGPYLASAGQLFREMPLQALTVHADNTRWREPINLAALLASESLAPIRQLTFSLTRFTPETARNLRECPRLTNLRELAFKYATFDPGAGRELLQPPLIEKLESLEIEATTVTWNDFAAAILDAGGPHRLRRFRFMPFTSMWFSLSHVFDAALFRGLRELEISRCEMGGDHVRALCQSSAVRELESLTLSSTLPGVPGVKAIAECESLRGLKCLRLSGNRLGPVAMKNIARSRHLAGLQVLDLTTNPLGDKGAIELAKAPWLKNLVSLGLMHCDIGDAGAEALCEALNLGTLVHMDLYSSDYRAKLSDAVKQKLRDRLKCYIFM